MNLPDQSSPGLQRLLKDYERQGSIAIIEVRNCHTFHRGPVPKKVRQIERQREYLTAYGVPENDVYQGLVVIRSRSSELSSLDFLLHLRGYDEESLRVSLRFALANPDGVRADPAFVSDMLCYSYRSQRPLRELLTLTEGRDIDALVRDWPFPSSVTRNYSVVKGQVCEWYARLALAAAGSFTRPARTYANLICPPPPGTAGIRFATERETDLLAAVDIADFRETLSRAARMFGGALRLGHRLLAT